MFEIVMGPNSGQLHELLLHTFPIKRSGSNATIVDLVKVFKPSLSKEAFIRRTSEGSLARLEGGNYGSCETVALPSGNSAAPLSPIEVGLLSTRDCVEYGIFH